MSERLKCLVPSCGRTFPKDGSITEVLCGRHYRMAPASVRQEYRIVRRKIAGRQRRRPENRDEAELDGLYDEANRLWDAIKSHVLNADYPGGLSAFLEDMGMS